MALFSYKSPCSTCLVFSTITWSCCWSPNCCSNITHRAACLPPHRMCSTSSLWQRVKEMTDPVRTAERSTNVPRRYFVFPTNRALFVTLTPPNPLTPPKKTRTFQIPNDRAGTLQLTLPEPTTVCWVSFIVSTSLFTCTSKLLRLET